MRGRTRRAVLAGLATGVTLSVGTAGHGSVRAVSRAGETVGTSRQATAASGRTAGPDIVANYTFSLTPDRRGEVSVRLRWELPPTVSSFAAELPERTKLTGSTDFEQVEKRRFEWQEDTRTPSLRFRWSVSTDRFDSDTAGVDTGDWALVTQPAVKERWDRTGEPPGYDAEMAVDGTGVSSRGITYLGPHETRTVEVPDQTVEVVVPTAAEEPDETVLRGLQVAGRVLDTGYRPDRVTGFLVPQSVRTEDGGGAIGPSFWVNDDSPAETPDNTWIHELAHTRQGYAIDRSMRWLVEGAAEFYAAMLSYRAGLIDYWDAYSDLRQPRYESQVLAEPSSWPSDSVAYTKGGRVVAALDAIIRERTDASYMAVSRRLHANATEGRVGLSDFRAAVSGVADEKLGSRAHEWATTEAAPAVPHAPERYETEGTTQSPTPVDTPTVMQPATATPTATETEADPTATSTDRRTATGSTATGGETRSEGPAAAGETATDTPGLGAAGAVTALVAALVYCRQRARNRRE